MATYSESSVLIVMDSKSGNIQSWNGSFTSIHAERWTVLSEIALVGEENLPEFNPLTYLDDGRVEMLEAMQAAQREAVASVLGTYDRVAIITRHPINGFAIDQQGFTCGREILHLIKRGKNQKEYSHNQKKEDRKAYMEEAKQLDAAQQSAAEEWIANNNYS